MGYPNNACTKCGTTNGSEFHRMQHEADCYAPDAETFCEGCGSVLHPSLADTHRRTCSRPLITRREKLKPNLVALADSLGPNGYALITQLKAVAEGVSQAIAEYRAGQGDKGHE